MTSAMQALYIYAQEYMVHPLLAQEPEYEEILRCADKQEQEFCALLDDTAQKRLEALLDERSMLAFHQEQAMFRAGFRLALELTRV